MKDIITGILERIPCGQSTGRTRERETIVIKELGILLVVMVHDIYDKIAWGHTHCDCISTIEI